jgi:kinesin family protein 5
VCGGQAEQLRREKEELEEAVEQTRREFESKAQALDREREEEKATHNEEKRKQLEQELNDLRQKTAQKLAEFDQLKTSLLRDLQNRCEKVNRTCAHDTHTHHDTRTHTRHAHTRRRASHATRHTPQVIDLEMLLDEAREQYEQLLKNSSNKSLQVFRPSSHSPSLSFFLSFFSSPTHAFVLPPARVQKRNMFLERNLEQLTRVHQQLVNQNNELRLEKKVSEKKLAARNERIRGLEVLLSSAQEKLQQQSEKYATHTHTHTTRHTTHTTHTRV